MKTWMMFCILLSSSTAFGQMSSSMVFSQQNISSGPWSLKSDRVNPVLTAGCQTQPCAAQSIPLPTSGNLLVIFAFTGQNVKISSISGAGTWTLPTNCNSFDAMDGAGGISCGYTVVSAPVNSLSITLSANTSSRVQFEIREYHFSGTGTITAENIPVATVSTACGAINSPCASPSITLSGTNEVMISAYTTGGHACQVLSPYRNFNGLTNGYGATDNMNTSSGTGASFIQSASLNTCNGGLSNNFAAMVSIAFFGQVAASGWTFISDAYGPFTGGGCPTSVCAAQTIPATTSGDLLVAFALTGDNITMSSISGASSGWVFPPNCDAFQSASTGGISCAYAIVSSSVTTVTPTMSANTSNYVQFEFREYRLAAGQIGAEAIPAGTTSTSCGAAATPCTAATVAVTGTKDIILSAIAPQFHVCSVLSPFTNFPNIVANGWGAADNLNTTSGTGSGFTLNNTGGSGGCTGTANQNASMVSIGFSNAGGAPGISMNKSASPNSFSTTGTLITYTYHVVNSGGTTLNGPFTITDSKQGSITTCVGPLSPGQTSNACTSTHSTTQADLDSPSGNISNTAFVTGNSLTSANTPPVVVTAVQSPAITFTSKVPNPTTFSAANQSIQYTYTIKNTGNVTLSNPITIIDDHITGSTGCGASPLAPNATLVCSIATYTTTPADVTAGSVTNTAHATTTFP